MRCITWPHPGFITFFPLHARAALQLSCSLPELDSSHWIWTPVLTSPVYRVGHGRTSCFFLILAAPHRQSASHMLATSRYSLNQRRERKMEAKAKSSQHR
ncbi:hypothetical protein B0T18DRAFT_71431 [Schizothecium vesticola]|uniref:Secreted protein n=1 Tax=Schizothecium vesticola TaxID=314040 RepID=A0AA40F5H8_9PEZI|nr:hypothetical protein B0T18DRAFT_71431 [Schizothecium vesticola]